jgi:hypothetical protein
MDWKRMKWIKTGDRDRRFRDRSDVGIRDKANFRKQKSAPCASN